MAVAHDYFVCYCDSKHTKQIINRFHVLFFSIDNLSFIHTQTQRQRPILKITHVWHNEMQRTIEDHKALDELRGCFYRGRVRTDDRSAVAVSLCDGMVSVWISIYLFEMRFSETCYICNKHISTWSVIWNFWMDGLFRWCSCYFVSSLLTCPKLICCSLCVWWWWLSRISMSTCDSGSILFFVYSWIFICVYCVSNFEIVNSNVSLIIWICCKFTFTFNCTVS